MRHNNEVLLEKFGKSLLSKLFELFLILEEIKIYNAYRFEVENKIDEKLESNNKQ